MSIKKQLQRFTISCFFILGFSAPAWSVTLVIDAGELIGVNNVNVGGTKYDVQFIDGTCAAVFGDCTDNASFTFDRSGTETAAQALLDQVFNAAGTDSNGLTLEGGLYDIAPEQTRGITSTTVARMLILSNEKTTGKRHYSTLYNFKQPHTDVDRIGCFATSASCNPLAQYANNPGMNASAQAEFVYTKWSVAAPTPTTVGLLSLVLAGMVRRKTLSKLPIA